MRVRQRVAAGGHDVPEQKIVERWHRLWAHVVTAIPLADEVVFYDNGNATRPFRIVARPRDGRTIEPASWPDWAPPELKALDLSPEGQGQSRV